MKNIFTKVLGTSMALTLVLASAAPATAPAVKSAKAEAVKAAVVETEDAAEAKTDLGILEAVEKKIAEKAEIKTEAKETAKAEAAEEVKAEAKAEVKAEAEETVKAEAPLAEVVIERAEAEEAAELELKAPELAAQTAAKAEAPEAAAETAQAEEAAAPAPATEAAEEEPVVKVWNISATEADNVEMKFVAKTKNVSVYEGEVTISGEGAMEESVYTNFLSVEKYIEATKAAFEEEYGVTVRLDYDPEIEDVIELDSTLKVYAETSNDGIEEGAQLYVTENMIRDMDYTQLLEFSPTKITINEGITSVSDCAFIACADLTEVVLPKTIETIGDRAFMHCTRLKRVIIPEDAEIVTGAFGDCFDLDTVVLASDDDYAAPDNFAGQSVKTMPEDQVQRLIDGI